MVLPCSTAGAPGVRAHLPVGLSTTLCSSCLLASFHCPGVLSCAGDSLQNLATKGLLGEQPEGLLTDGPRAFSCSAALRRDSCLSKNQGFKSVVYLFVCALIKLGASALSLRARRAPHPGVGHPVGLGLDGISLCCQRDPDGNWAACLVPRCTLNHCQPASVSSESNRVLTLQTGVGPEVVVGLGSLFWPH